MTADMFTKLLRAFLTAFLAYGAGRGWFKITAADAGVLIQSANDAAPILFGLAVTFYANWHMKNVPAATLVVDVGSDSKKDTDTFHAPGMLASVKTDNGTAIGKILILTFFVLFFLSPHNVFALDAVTNSSCDPVTVFKGMTPQNFQSRVKACGDEDLTNALADANVPPLNYTALGCLTGIKVLRDAVVKGGVLTMFEAYGRAKSQGLISNCTNWVLTTVAP